MCVTSTSGFEASGSTSTYGTSRGPASVASTKWRESSSSASAIQVVPTLPSNAANGRCSGNCAICGEYGACTEEMPSYSATVCASGPRANGSSTAASDVSGTDAGNVQP